MSSQRRLLIAGLGLTLLLAGPLLLAAVVIRPGDAGTGAALAVPDVGVGKIATLRIADLNGIVAVEPLPPRPRSPHHHCLSVPEWLLVRHSQVQVEYEGCTPVSGRWTGLMAGRSTNSPESITMIPAIPLEHALAAGLEGSGRLHDYLVPTPDRAWLWFPAFKGPAQRRSGRSIEDWQPAQPRLRCIYAKRWLATKLALDLSVSQAEADKLAEILDGCGPEGR